MLVIKQFGPVTYAMGTLQEILAGTGIAAKVRALPNDVAGCTLEMGADGKWVGTLGTMSKAPEATKASAVALANLATGATYHDTSSTQYTYGGTGAGWVCTSDIGPGSPSTPFTTIAERTAWATQNLAALRSGASTVWGPGNVEYVWNGPLATDWIDKPPFLIGLGSASNPFDIAIWGGTASAVASAIRARRLGQTVIMLAEFENIGGLVTGGISNTDVGGSHSKGKVSGYANELYAKGAKYYSLDQQTYLVSPNTYKLECKVAKRLIEQDLAEAGVFVVKNVALLGVVFDSVGDRISALKTSHGAIHCRAAVDGSYTGDLVRLSSVPHTIGREASTTYAETTYGGMRLTPSGSPQFPDGIDPYVVAGDATSGLLPGVEDIAFATGEASPRVQAVGFRMSVTTDADKIAFPEPDAGTYNPANYELFGRLAASATGQAWTSAGDVFDFYTLTPASSTKFDLNSKAAFSTDYLGPEATEYVTATRERRAEIYRHIRNYVLGLLKFIKDDSRFVAAVKTSLATYGLCPDEFKETDYLPPELYIREGVRMVSDTVLKYSDLSANTSANWCGFYSYGNCENHNATRLVSGGMVKNEGEFFFNTPPAGFRIPLGVILPPATSIKNLVVGVCISASHVGWSSIRYEPNYMMFGDAAGVLASYAAITGDSVQSEAAAAFHTRFSPITTRIKNGGIYSEAKGSEKARSQCLVTTVGAWQTQGPNPPVAAICDEQDATSSTTASKRFQPYLRTPKMLRPRIKFSISGGVTKSTAVPVVISHAGGTTTLSINQNGADDRCESGDWDDLGSYLFRAGTDGNPSQDYLQFGPDPSGVRISLQAIWFEEV